MLILLLLAMGVATFFISLHADAGEAILILYLMESEFFQHRRTVTTTTSRYNEVDSEVQRFLSHNKLRESRPW